MDFAEAEVQNKYRRFKLLSNLSVLHVNGMPTSYDPETGIYTYGNRCKGMVLCHDTPLVMPDGVALAHIRPVVKNTRFG